ncbi:hypothetical protein WJ969_02695 [Achromobacter xylosoxidans]
MEHFTQQTRITLRNLKVADFASEETLCFTATVVFDSESIAHADNSGRGGMTSLFPLEGKHTRLLEASEYASSLPADTLGPADGLKDPLTVGITLDYLVDTLAETMHNDRKDRSAFNRHMAGKLLFVKDGKLKYAKVKPKSIANLQSFFTKLRDKQGHSIVILVELPREEAFALWKRYMAGDELI